jgi:Amt family ammonium transporter
MSQIFGSLLGAGAGLVSGLIVYTVVDFLFTFRLSPDDERIGADLAIHKIGANPEEEVRTGRP